MISNERSFTHKRPSHPTQAYGQAKFTQPRPPVNENILKSSEVQIERKNFIFSLKENARGRFLCITEDVGGRRDTIIIPSTGLEEFKKLLDEMVQASAQVPDKA